GRRVFIAVGRVAGGKRRGGVGELEVVADGLEVVGEVGAGHDGAVGERIIPLALLHVDAGIGEGELDAGGIAGHGACGPVGVFTLAGAAGEAAGVIEVEVADDDIGD